MSIPHPASLPDDHPLLPWWVEHHRETEAVKPGTYELVGPKINGNPEGAERHRLESHANAQRLDGWDLTYDSLREHLTSWIAEEGIEGIVWHHPDGRMAKLKTRDFPPG